MASAAAGSSDAVGFDMAGAASARAPRASLPLIQRFPRFGRDVAAAPPIGAAQPQRPLAVTSGAAFLPQTVKPHSHRYWMGAIVWWHSADGNDALPWRKNRRCTSRVVSTGPSDSRRRTSWRLLRRRRCQGGDGGAVGDSKHKGNEPAAPQSKAAGDAKAYTQPGVNARFFRARPSSRGP